MIKTSINKKVPLSIHWCYIYVKLTQKFTLITHFYLHSVRLMLYFLILYKFYELKQRYFFDSAIRRPAMMAFMILVGTYVTTGQLILRYFLIENNNQQRNIDPQKLSAEKLNGRFALLGVIALVGAYISTGQINHGIV